MIDILDSFDAPYFNKIAKWIMGHTGQIYPLAAVKNVEKFIEYCKFYEDNRVTGMPEITFNETYTKLKIHVL